MALKVLLAVLLFSLCNADKESYDGLKVIRVIPQTAQHVHLLHELQEDTQLDFWSEPSDVGQSVDIMPTAALLPSLVVTLQVNNIPHSVMIDDVQKLIDTENDVPQSPGEPEAFSLTRYNRLAYVHSWLDSVAASCEVCTVTSLGKSSQGRDLKVFKIGIPGSNKKSIFMDGTIHAREWISVAVMLNLINKFVTTYETDTEVRRLLERFDWHLVPVLNPDGYEYSHTSERMWRKTRRPNSDVGSTCVGTDGNRNFGFQWGGTGSSGNPCSNTYRGPRAFSEPETRLMQEYILARAGTWISYLAVHSYGQLWLTPWGYTRTLPPDYNELAAVGNTAARALASYRGTTYRVGSSTRILYAACGGSDDWAYGGAKIKFSYTLELPDTGRYGFILPASQIAPSSEEMWLAIKAMGKAIPT